MKIMVDLDPKDVWRITDKAEKAGITPGEVLRDELAVRRSHLELRNRIRSRVLAGMCDADIARELSLTNRVVSDIRRGEGLPANRRNRKAS